ncbi:MAG TPA: peptidase domain-containing ABC transporter [Xanthomonadaceae bacterium]
MSAPDAHPAGDSPLDFGWSRRLPVYLQTEATECGLACLAMLARYHGCDVDVAGVRRRFSSSLKGANLSRLMEMAESLGFACRPVKVDLEQLKLLKTPCLLHWDLNHFVVLKSVTSRKVVVHDPAKGVLILTPQQVSRHFTGIAMEVSPAADFKPVRERQRMSLRALTGRVPGLGRALLQILALALALEVFALAGPFFLQWVLDQVVVSADRDLLVLLGAGFTGLAIARALTTVARAWAITWLSAMLNLQWSGNLFAHLIRLPLDWFEKRHVGDVVSRFGSVQAIQRTLTNQFVGSLVDGGMAVVTLVVLAMYSAALAGLVLALFAAYALLRWLSFRQVRQAHEEQIVYEARQESELLESIRGAMPIKLANKQPDRLSRYLNAVSESINRGIRIQRLDIGFLFFNETLFGVGRVALVWLAATLVLRNAFTAGALVAFVAYADQFFVRASGLIDAGIELGMLGLYVERASDIAASPVEKHMEPRWEGSLDETSIELRNVSFRYAQGEPWILRNCSLRIEPGESVALVGPSGCGKTTLVKLVLGLLEPCEGKVLFGGVDIRDLGLARYRGMLAAVMQDDQLFAGSIADNIAFFDAAATPERVQSAARAAAIHQDILAMTMGYNTHVGDMGSVLSGGQKQRVILARAIYREPRLLVLDEATSHLDMRSERTVNESIRLLNITRVFIAHRAETIASADRVLALGPDGIRTLESRRPMEAA